MLTLDQARNLKPAEFKVLAVAAGLFATEPGKQGSISTRDLAEATGIERRNVQLAIGSLKARKLIRTTPGRGPKPPTLHLDFLLTEKITGVVTTPVTAETRGTSGVVTTPVTGVLNSRVAEIHSWVASKQRQYAASGVETTPQGALFTGVETTPVGAEAAAGQGDAGARVDSKTPDLNPDIDRGKSGPPTETPIVYQVLTAKPRDWDAQELREARRWVHGYQCHQGDQFHADPERDRNPPDETVLSQILAATGGLGQLIKFIQLITGKSEPPGSKYAWYVTTALNICHGVEAKAVKQARAQLRIARKPSPPAIAGEQQQLLEQPPAEADPQFSRELLQDLQRRRKGANG
jgi:hypothetical protein